MPLIEEIQRSLGTSYTVERELGGGGMSRVFLAHDTRLHRAVVVKILSSELSAALSNERFEREIQLAAALQHPHIVPVLSAGDAGGMPYYVMPFIEGESLRSRLSAGTVPLSLALSILRDVLRALEFAHQHGVVHRDIKPENVLLSGGSAVVSDFGIAKAISAARESTEIALTREGISLGTPAYMSPEQAVGEPVDHRADIYSWGVVAYEILCSRHPFADKVSTGQMIAAHVAEAPPPLGKVAPHVPPHVCAIVMQCLAKDREQRPDSALRLLDSLAIATTPGAGVSLFPPKARRFMPVVAVGIAAVAIAFAVTRSRSEPPLTGPRSVAVLPFDVVGGDTADTYFAEGMADELTTVLSKLPTLRVASRSAAFSLARSGKRSAREVGTTLGVQTVLEGSVQRAGERLRVRAQLVNVADGLTVWSDTYERSAKDVFAMQDDIARAIARAFGPVASVSADSTIGATGTSNVDAYDLYLRARYLLERRGKGVSLAVDYFQQAIGRDSAFAKAYAGLADALELMPYFSPVPARQVEARALAAATRGLELDPSLAEAYVAIAMAHQHAYRWAEADAAYRKALSVEPSFVPALYQYGRFLLGQARTTEGLVMLQKARRIDPLSPTTSVWLSYGLAVSGDVRGAIAEGKRVRALDSTLFTVQVVPSEGVLNTGDTASARAMLGHVGSAELSPGFSGIEAYVRWAIGDRDGARGIIRQLEALPADRWMVATAKALAYASLDTARALAAMEDALRKREIPASWTPLSDRLYDPLRNSPRFAVVLRGYGLDEKTFRGKPR